MAKPLLLGKRIRLALLERHHLPKRVEFINDPDVQANLNFDYPTSLAKTEAWFAKNVLSANRIDFALELIEEQLVIGFGGFINVDQGARKAELYILVGDKKYWNRGFGRDGYKLLANYGFQEMGLERIYLYQHVTNERAVKATAHLGWTTEGCLRKDIWSHGTLKDQYVVSILRDEWAQNNVYSDV